MIFRKHISLEPNKVEKIVQTCVLLHNYLKRNAQPPGTFDIEDLDSGTVRPGLWRNDPKQFYSMLPLKIVPNKSLHEVYKG